MASNRLNQLASHLSGNSSSASRIGVKNPEDVVIVDAVRTPICKAGKGKFKDTHHEYLLSLVLKAVCERAGLDKALVEDIVVGNVLPPSSGAGLARMAMLHAGFSESSSCMTVNRQCSSGLQAVAQVASAIRDGTIEIGIGAGVEAMSKFYASGGMKIEEYDQEILKQQNVADCLIPMGITSENVASDFGVSREKQDRFSASSHAKAANAQKNGLFNQEIIPVPTKFVGADGKVTQIVVTADDGVRPTTSFEGLSKLKPAFKQGGTTTAGNSSQVSDGAAAVLLMKRSRAIELGLPILGKFVTSAAVGVPPRIMGVGPAYAIPAAIKKAGITLDDVDIFEINEAFASQAVYSVEKLGIDINKVNPKGGAIAFGHPLGCTGARQVSTLLFELRRTGKKVGLTSMCIGSGMGMCGIFEAE
ncbi:3-ketoacyl-CoA thiolase B, peroxisomal [Smittium culicis]|uniref:3-ketoacyl-CoA thiolase B, peroxisomal n=1 Tax=Smittium culicis TaxID=133412 RepID=A0A1R1XXV5_9FUNG|nr:3-ketoacyl-CoA thiolase B, peroxisomal [Smittium culicis]